MTLHFFLVTLQRKDIHCEHISTNRLIGKHQHLPRLEWITVWLNSSASKVWPRNEEIRRCTKGISSTLLIDGRDVADGHKSFFTSYADAMHDEKKMHPRVRQHTTSPLRTTHL